MIKVNIFSDRAIVILLLCTKFTIIYYEVKNHQLNFFSFSFKKIKY